MPKTSKNKKQYFQHDLYAYEDKKIKKLVAKMGDEGYGLFWRIVEFMHREEIKTGEEYLISGVEKENNVKSILNDFELFRIEKNYYISDRIVRNLNTMEEKQSAKREAAQIRWILSKYCSVYNAVFDTELILTGSEKNKLIDLNKNIPDLQNKLTDIFYTIKQMKPFDNGVTPNSSWLLQKDNLIDVLNGKYGRLKHKKSEQELAEEQQARRETFVSETDAIKSKSEAVEFIKSQGLTKKNPVCKKLMSDFNITESEVFNE